MIRQTMPDGFERCVETNAAFDYRYDKDLEKRKRGAHCAEWYFALVGPMGAISMRIFTGWMPGGKDGRPVYESLLAMAAGLAVHKRVTTGGEKRFPCEWLGECVDGGVSYIGGDKPFRIWVEEGEEALFAELREWYDREFPTN